MTRVVVLAGGESLRVVGPTLPVGDHLDRRWGLTVCFCGQPLRPLAGYAFAGDRCADCGYVRPRARGREPLELGEIAGELLG